LLNPLEVYSRYPIPQLIGARQGVLRPREQLLISPRLYRLLLELKARRFEIEVAHWA
jgi:hypothetical protein